MDTIINNTAGKNQYCAFPNEYKYGSLFFFTVDTIAINAAGKYQYITFPMYINMAILTFLLWITAGK